MALKLPVYHVLENEIKNCVDRNIYDREVLAMEDVLEKDKISSTLERIRQDAGIK